MASNEKQITIGLVVFIWPLRKAFVKLLSDLGYTVQSSFGNGNEMIANFAGDALPHIILIDADREETAALETVRWLREHHPSVKILAFTLEGGETLIKPLLDSGAHGYLCKAADTDEIKRAIKSVLKGLLYPSNKSLAIKTLLVYTATLLAASRRLSTWGCNPSNAIHAKTKFTSTRTNPV